MDQVGDQAIDTDTASDEDETIEEERSSEPDDTGEVVGAYDQGTKGTEDSVREVADQGNGDLTIEDNN